jgi:outer membrane receptor protein involved in Fe transport
MVQKATRAPNVNELFAPNVTGLSNLATDPCQGTNINRADAGRAGTLSNLCVLTGVPASEVGSLPAPSSGQINVLSGGNTALGPESAKTRTIGFVIEPLPRLALSVDYYDIRITDAVSSPSSTDILDRCYSAAQNPSFANNEFCGMIGRNTINGTFNGNESRGVALPLSNLGKQRTSGVDLNLAYRFGADRLGFDKAWGNFDVSLGANQVNSYKFQATPTAVERDCLGYYSIACNNIVSSPVYKRKFNQRTSWTMGAFSLGYNWRYVSAVIEEPGGTVFLPAYASIPAYHYVDMNAGWNFSKNVRLIASVTNVANKKPPIVGSSIGGTGPNSGNTFPQSYDAVGRYVTLGASVKF